MVSVLNGFGLTDTHRHGLVESLGLIFGELVERLVPSLLGQVCLHFVEGASQLILHTDIGKNVIFKLFTKNRPEEDQGNSLLPADVLGLM